MIYYYIYFYIYIHFLFAEMDSYKVVFVGNANVGKSHMVRKLLNAAYPNPKYIATLGVEVNSVIHNNVRFNIWDVAGHEKYLGLEEGYYTHGDVFFIFHGNENGYRTPEQWEEEIRSRIDDPVIYHVYNNDVNELVGDLEDFLILQDNN